MNYSELSNQITDFLLKDQWSSTIALIALTLCATYVIHYIAQRLLIKLITITSRNSVVWDEILIESVTRPFLFFIWVFAAFFCLEYINPYVNFEIKGTVTLLRSLSFIAAIAWALSEAVVHSEQYWLRQYKANKSKLDPTSIGAIVKVMNILIVVFTGLTLMQFLGFSVSALVAFMGGGGVVAGFAAKDLLANFFGAVIIYFDRPFKVGDWISSPDKEIEGNVEKISLRTTVIRTFDKRPLYVPNSFFNTISIQNPSRMTHRRIKETIPLRHCDFKVAHKIANDIEKMFIEDEKIDNNQTLFVTVDTIDNVSINILIYVITTVTAFTEFYKYKQEKMIEVMKIVAKHNAKFADLTSNSLIPQRII